MDPNTFKITDIDFHENDACLEVGGIKAYFQFEDSSRVPTLEDAIKFFVKDSKFYLNQ